MTIFGPPRNDPRRRYGTPQRRGIPIRLLIGLGIALFALISYFSRTEINPVTGEKQRIAMSVEQEKALGLQSAPQMAAKMGGVVDPRSDARAAIVAEVGNKLVRHSTAARSPYADNFNFYLLNDTAMVNAFALPGGQIFITRALFEKLEWENELAGVLGHEIGHVIHRHGAEHMATGQLGQMLVMGVGIGASDNASRGRLAMMAAAMASQMLQMKYSRSDELESDRYGLDAMVDAGLNPAGMLRVMEVLMEASKGRTPPAMMSSHPHPEARIEKIKAYLGSRFPDGVPQNLSRGRPLRAGTLPQDTNVER
jgi:predicted Zn-dependent protease